MTDIVERLRVWPAAYGEDAMSSTYVGGMAKNAADEIEQLREALAECVEVLALVERPAFVDPDYCDEVAALGDRIGYGALMTSTPASWRERLEEEDCPTGGEFVAGPCYATVLAALKKARSALPPAESRPAENTGGGQS